MSDSQISYRWALDAAGRPIPIDQATRGGQYVCPLCHGPMIARLGQQLQHHYGHERLTDCTPETVNRAVLRRWLAIHIEQALKAQTPVTLRWQCPYCDQKHHANLLHGVARFTEDEEINGHYADIALFDARDRLFGAILIEDKLTPAQEDFFTAGDRFLLTLPHMATLDEDDLLAILRQAQVISAPCPLLANMPDVIRDPAGIKKVLLEAVSRFPGYAFGALETINGVANLVKLAGKLLLLPKAQWRKVVGGSRNPVIPGVEIIIQTWQHPDGGDLYLYFVTARETQAVGIRRYSPGAMHTPELDFRSYHRNTSAADIVRQLVTR
ncbi:MAG: hypothetical protein KF726_27430 [Anaerolineae bacterium]|nr:hypothetical protein [Anaerolineae bacterium]